MTEPPPEKRLEANARYHSDTQRIGKSGLDKINESPAHYWAAYLDPNRERPEPTPAMIFGSLFHTVVLEPDLAELEYVVAPSGLDRRTKDGKAWALEHADRQIVSAADWDHAQKMRASILANPYVAKALAVGVAEQPIYTLDPETWVDVKIKPDWWNPELGMILDLKTTTCAREKAFASSIAEYRYHVQAAFYTDMARASGLDVKSFALVAVEKRPPYAHKVWVLDDESLEFGRAEYKRNLATYAQCLAANHWPAYDPEPQFISLPSWALKTP